MENKATLDSLRILDDILSDDSSSMLNNHRRVHHANNHASKKSNRMCINKDVKKKSVWTRIKQLLFNNKLDYNYYRDL